MPHRPIGIAHAQMPNRRENARSLTKNAGGVWGLDTQTQTESAEQRSSGARARGWARRRPRRRRPGSPSHAPRLVSALRLSRAALPPHGATPPHGRLSLRAPPPGDARAALGTARALARAGSLRVSCGPAAARTGRDADSASQPVTQPETAAPADPCPSYSPPLANGVAHFQNRPPLCSCWSYSVMAARWSLVQKVP
jgi:hypothetical protein